MKMEGIPQKETDTAKSPEMQRLALIRKLAWEIERDGAVRLNMEDAQAIDAILEKSRIKIDRTR